MNSIAEKEAGLIGTMFRLARFGSIQPDIQCLKESCDDLARMMTQKTAGQRGKAGDVSFDNLERLISTICVESMLLNESGLLDKLQEEKERKEK